MPLRVTFSPITEGGPWPYDDSMTTGTPTRTTRQVIDECFLENRAKVLDLAAFLDRVDRAASSVSPAAKGAPEDDFRTDALRRAIALLLDGQPERARRILELWSDHSTEPIAAAPMKGALGAVDLRAGTQAKGRA